MYCLFHYHKLLTRSVLFTVLGWVHGGIWTGIQFEWTQVHFFMALSMHRDPKAHCCAIDPLPSPQVAMIFTESTTWPTLCDEMCQVQWWSHQIWTSFDDSLGKKKQLLSNRLEQISGHNVRERNLMWTEKVLDLLHQLMKKGNNMKVLAFIFI